MIQQTDAARWGGVDPNPPPADLVEPEHRMLLEYVSGGRVAVITINRPPRNALTTAMAARLSEFLDEVAAKITVRAVILTGAGDESFCIGMDLRERNEMTKEQWLTQRANIDRLIYTVRQLRRPIFSAVNGLCVAGGCEIAESTDFIIASENARFGQPEAMVGLSAGGGGPVFLPRLLSPGKALQMLMTGEPISAQEAHRLGMVNEVCAPEDLMNVAVEIAEKIARNSPTAVQAVKHAAKTAQGEPTEQAIAIMMEAHWISALHSDRLEGIGAWNERREPIFPDPDR